MSSKKSLRLFALVALSLLLTARNAFAYVDPGTGSFLLQFLIAGLLGAAFVFKGFWRNIRDFWSKLLSKR
jgi:16S rRNA C1402 (ribose-2'-O) methylase RsmI